jgi:hypothetical protein
MNKRGVYDLISVFGAIVLFSAWIFQQTSVEKQRAVISNLDQAEGEYPAIPIQQCADRNPEGKRSRNSRYPPASDLTIIGSV